MLLLSITLLISCSEQNKKSSEGKKNTIPVNEKAVSLTLPELNNTENLFEKINFKPQDKPLEIYKTRKLHRPDNMHRTIYLIPFGNMKPEVEEILKKEVKYLEAFFQLPVKLLDRVPFDDIKKIEAVETRMIGASDYDYYSKEKDLPHQNIDLHEQINARSFIQHYLKHNKPEDAVAVLGITEHDIYAPKFNYLFGLSNTQGGLGLVSTFRLIDYKETTRDNIRKVISKQITNMFSIPNVKDYVCLLNFHNNKEELEKGIFHISPVALEKLKYNIGFNHHKRFSDLQNFWLQEGNKEQAGFYEECIQLLLSVK